MVRNAGQVTENERGVLNEHSGDGAGAFVGPVKHQSCDRAEKVSTTAEYYTPPPPSGEWVLG